MVYMGLQNLELACISKETKLLLSVSPRDAFCKRDFV